MKIFCAVIVLLVSFGAVHAKNAAPVAGLPDGAFVIEIETLKQGGYPNRAIALWMLNPAKNPSDARDDPDLPYTCPEYSRGSHYSGPTWVSLIDTAKNAVINSVKVADSFDIPYAIRKGYYYQVHGNPGKDREGKAHVLSLKDYNGDGRSLEFALFDAETCMGLMTALIGYSAAQDKVVQYPVKLEVRRDKGSTIRVSGWCDYLFSEKPQSPGFWKYTIDYRGREGLLNKYEIRYNPAREMFEGTLVQTAAEEVGPSADAEYATYTSAKFGFTIQYPRSFVPLASSDNRGSVTLTSPDGQAELTVSGGDNPGLTAKEYYAKQLRDLVGRPGYRTVKQDWFVLTWRDKEKISYLKMFVGKTSYNSFIFSYPASQKTRYDEVATKVEKSFRPGKIDQTR